ncbi:hypothetical protein Pint_36654 [Pistacia integerrima]|uniref:Uncharacterized protein n=1 Tax=Pistacia integerrima TaxID=434235 RepID=A0ACC0Y1H7_9ROSI|nr:hypothetical protein Pint_36654 [Pistacia integerrima]
MNDFDSVPPVYTVGPVIDLESQSDKLVLDVTRRNEIMKWLDDQPDSSVVFLCFGSWGSFGEERVKEIVIGLEQSGVRFLWSLRKPPLEDKFEEEILPNGFLEKTKEIGLVCGWAPQKEVVAHKSVGGFVSHCGWNSILESLWFGVPIVTWTMYAEQQLKAFQMVKDLGMGLELKLDYKSTGGEVVSGDEIAEAIKCVMYGAKKVGKKRVKEVSENSRLAVMEGGSSFNSYRGLIDDRTKKMGTVCGWAPQKAVLAHKSVGGFVSHCGWNSILESLWFGVPIVTWPMYAEQQINAFQMVKDLGLGVELRLDYRNTSGEVVLGDEIASAIKCVMESDNEVRKKVKEKSEKSRSAVMEGGSSFAAYGELIENLLRNMSCEANPNSQTLTY